MAAQTNKQKQAALRARRSEQGLKEMRGIWVTNDEEIIIKPKVRKMLKAMRKAAE